MKHACAKCGFRHNAPKASSIIINLTFAIGYGVLYILAARALDGWLSVAFWVLTGISVLAWSFVVYGLALVATGDAETLR